MLLLWRYPWEFLREVYDILYTLSAGQVIPARTSVRDVLNLTDSRAKDFFVLLSSIECTGFEGCFVGRNIGWEMENCEGRKIKKKSLEL